MIIDAHTHMGPALAHRSDVDTIAAETGAELVSLLDASGVDMACTFPPILQGMGFEDPTYARSNEAIYHAVREFPERIIGFCRVNPNHEHIALDEMRRCREEYGFKGLKLHPDWESFTIDGPIVRPIVERAGEYGWPIVFHTGYYPLSHPTLMLPLAERYPEVQFVMFHLSYAHTDDAIVVAERCPNVYLETSANGTAEGIHEALRRLGPGKLVYGSDAPYTYPRDVLDKIRLQPDMTRTDLDAILGGTMARLLGIGGNGGAA